MSETATELEAPDPMLSSDAADSTYAAAPAIDPEPNPPSGPSVVQTLGEPGASAKASSKKASSPSSSSSSSSSS
jgi:hypothetical protein